MSDPVGSERLKPAGSSETNRVTLDAVTEVRSIESANSELDTTANWEVVVEHDSDFSDGDIEDLIDDVLADDPCNVGDDVSDCDSCGGCGECGGCGGCGCDGCDSDDVAD
jgi:hypothetical protein